MAKNSGDNHRHGAVCNRSQAYNPKTDSWVKRDSKTGRFMDVKIGGNPFKGITKEINSERGGALCKCQKCKKNILADALLTVTS